MISKPVALLAAVTLASLAHAAESPEVREDRFALDCSGFMETAGQPSPGSRIMVGGIIDLRAMTVSGFGIGYAPIFATTGKEIRFGASPLEVRVGAQRIEGTIDRLSGATRVIVRSTKEPQTMLIGMELDCRPIPIPLTGY
jgi:hypothetical protein